MKNRPMNSRPTAVTLRATDLFDSAPDAVAAAINQRLPSDIMSRLAPTAAGTVVTLERPVARVTLLGRRRILRRMQSVLADVSTELTRTQSLEDDARC